MNELLIKTILVGIFTGIIGSFFGILGSSILLPSLLFFGIVKDYDTAIGTILLILMLPTTLLGVYEYNKRKQVNYEVGIILFITYFFSSYIGSYFTSKNIIIWMCYIIFIYNNVFLLLCLQCERINSKRIKHTF
jgi:uncharacterized membrane protein YfcA